MKIALAQINYHIGNFQSNLSKIIKAINSARGKNADLVIFSELSVCGYPPQDLLDQNDFIQECLISIQKIANHSKNIGVIVGSPSINKNSEGKKLYNSAYFLYNGKIHSTYNKILLPSYDIYDEGRYFESDRKYNILKFKGKNIAITICEDLWFDQPIHDSFGPGKLYQASPMEELIKLQPDFVVNISASPYSYTREEIKKNIFIDNAKKYKLPVFYVNQVGANSEYIFEGKSLVVNPQGSIFAEFKAFAEDFGVFDLEKVINSLVADPLNSKNNSLLIENIYDALVLGIRDFFYKMNLKQAIIGLSGGVDSAVTLVLATRALGKENLRTLLLPSVYSSPHSIIDAEKLANNLGVKYDIINIETLVCQFEKSLNPIFYNLPKDITEENIQARIRGTLLMAVSNKFGNILLNTSNKSEVAVGYGTLYGDLSGGLSVLGDVFKRDVYKLAEYINSDSEIIPKSTILKDPSAELKPNQRDKDDLPEYNILDDILFNYIELGDSQEKIIKQGKDKKAVERIIEMVNRSEYKRYQSPPILRISSKAFGAGRRMPLVAKH